MKNKLRKQKEKTRKTNFRVSGLILYLSKNKLIATSVTAPDIKRINVKLAASIASAPSASRQRIELKAKATSAKTV